MSWGKFPESFAERSILIISPEVTSGNSEAIGKREALQNPLVI